jgi:hypothetical protein
MLSLYNRETAHLEQNINNVMHFREKNKIANYLVTKIVSSWITLVKLRPVLFINTQNHSNFTEKDTVKVSK